MYLSFICRIIDDETEKYTQENEKRLDKSIVMGYYSKSNKM